MEAGELKVDTKAALCKLHVDRRKRMNTALYQMWLAVRVPILTVLAVSLLCLVPNVLCVLFALSLSVLLVGCVFAALMMACDLFRMGILDQPYVDTLGDFIAAFRDFRDAWKDDPKTHLR